MLDYACMLVQNERSCARLQQELPMHKRPVVIVFVLAGWLANGCSDPAPPAVDAMPRDCSLHAEIEARPGFPFDPRVFREDVWPVLATTCASAGCHLAPAGAGGFTIWPVSADPCDFASSFNAVYEKTDFRNDPRNSRVYASVTGANPAHPPLAGAPSLDVILSYVMSAYETYVDQFGESDPTQLFDLAVYGASIQPSLDAAGCLAAGCHALDSAAGGFGLHAQPAADSPELSENFRRVIKLVDFSTGQAGAPLSRIYVRSIDDHRGVRLPGADAEALLAWILDGLPPGDEPPPPGCADASAFDLEVFRDEIFPVLTGAHDLNDPDSGRVTTGCTRGPCHGADRGPGTLYLPETAPAEDNLRRFACFVDRANPSASQILVCPLDLPSCAVNPHPGEDIYAGVKDRNYQRVLSYLYASASESTPLDFAYFVRRLNPMFNDPDAVRDGAPDLSCADAVVCHGVKLVGGEPANFSNLALIPETTVEEDLMLNFIAAANFTYFPEPAQSSLFLYPTNEIANLENPLATGLPHPGGRAFAPTDPEAALILTWAGGLRTDDEGFLRHWLVAGDFPASDVTDQKILDEATILPAIFQLSGQSVRYHSGKWDGFFSDQRFIDLDEPVQGFPRDTAIDRLAYAVAYVINTRATEIRARLTVSSPSDVEIYAGAEHGVARDGAGVAVTVALPPYATTRQVTRILVKVFQASTDTAFGFEMQLADENGNLLTGATSDLVFKLGPEGGI
jgi:hypothetical protein